MDIRNWGLGQIMQLPDSCFGRRWPIIFAGSLIHGTSQYFISEIALPERSVIWQLFAWAPSRTGMEALNLSEFFTYLLGDQVPTAANMAAMEPLFPGVDALDGLHRMFYIFTGVLSMKMPVMSSGRRICLRAKNTSTVDLLFTTGLVVSSVPNEVPDCLISA